MAAAKAKRKNNQEGRKFARNTDLPIRKNEIAEKLNLRNEEKDFLLKFFGIFFALFALLKALDLRMLAEIIAIMEEALLKFFGFAVSREGTLLILQNRTFEIVSECTGLVLVILLIALLYSTKIRESARRRALLLYVPFLLVFNIFRLLITLVSAVLIPDFFDAMHVFLWFVDSGVVMFLWYHVLTTQGKGK